MPPVAAAQPNSDPFLDPFTGVVPEQPAPQGLAAAPDPFMDPFGATAPTGTLDTWGDTISDLVVDQLDPYNLALLAISFPVGGLFQRAASKLLGTELIGGQAIRMVTNKLTSTGVAAGSGRLAPGAAILPELAQGLGFSIPFSAPELFEEPPEGSSRTSEFMQSLAFNTLLDASLIGATIPLRFIGRAKREAQRTFEFSMRKGATPERAAADAFLAKIEMLKAHGVPSELLQKLLKQSRDGMNQDTAQLLDTLVKQHGPAVMQRAQALGLTPEQVGLGFKELIERNTAEAIVADLSKRVAKDVMTKTSTDVRQRLLTDPEFARIVASDLDLVFNPAMGANAEGRNAAIERLVKHGFDREAMRTAATPVVQAAREEMKLVLKELVPPKPTTTPVTPETREAGHAAFKQAFEAGQKPKLTLKLKGEPTAPALAPTPEPAAAPSHPSEMRPGLVFQVARLRSKKMSNKEIANKLGVTVAEVILAGAQKSL